ncbi:hypothetical protein NDR87_31800 [Nocardia sp. CDC159]|uniref:Uncharacterized protein n=1 Tax=Nocardia pulmonis TaxID=2951408 RepID=A0A9X2J1G3_9NOCA|nr:MULTISPECIES: hypothetical protein [Nocardia]MCM6778075.1 hypothetical protein [Nocardia pulmonis]MCM6790964.1 hypothetical protein [Nocardia sp. CDC159]
MTVDAEAGVRQLVDHHGPRLWGLLDWVPGGWLGHVLVLLAIALVTGSVVWLIGRGTTGSGRVGLKSDDNG